MTTYFTKHLFDGTSVMNSVLLTVEDGMISALQPDSRQSDIGADCIELNGLVTAGFVDTQVNGGGGALFNHDQSLSALTTIAKAHAKYGTTSMLPTLITDSAATMTSAANSIALAIAQDLLSIVGVHFEGPHLSDIKKGIHPSQHIRPITDKELATFTRTDIGKVLVTLAPENVPADVIADLVSQGVIVSLGHSGASIDQVNAAIDAGATGFTHLFNAMSGLTAREPGMIGAALSDVRMTSGLIADLHHVSAYNCALAYRCIGADRLMLVTDAMAHTGCDLKTLAWLNSHITRNGDKLTLENGSIAGSCLDMASAVRNMYSVLSATNEALTGKNKSLLYEVLNMASKTPANLLGLNNIGELKVGHQANFVLLDDQQYVKSCWLKGLLVS